MKQRRCRFIFFLCGDFFAHFYNITHVSAFHLISSFTLPFDICYICINYIEIWSDIASVVLPIYFARFPHKERNNPEKHSSIFETEGIVTNVKRHPEVLENQLIYHANESQIKLWKMILVQIFFNPCQCHKSIQRKCLIFGIFGFFDKDTTELPFRQQQKKNDFPLPFAHNHNQID